MPKPIANVFQCKIRAPASEVLVLAKDVDLVSHTKNLDWYQRRTTSLENEILLEKLCWTLDKPDFNVSSMSYETNTSCSFHLIF